MRRYCLNILEAIVLKPSLQGYSVIRAISKSFHLQLWLE